MFKVGDKVRCVNKRIGSDYLDMNKAYTVKDIDDNRIYLDLPDSKYEVAFKDYGFVKVDNVNKLRKLIK